MTREKNTALTVAVNSIIEALMRERASHVTAMDVLTREIVDIDAKLEAAQTLVTLNGQSPKTGAKMLPRHAAALAANREAAGGQFGYERCRDYLAEHGVTDAITLARRTNVSTVYTRRLPEFYPTLFKAIKVQRIGRGYKGGTALAVAAR